MKSLWEKESLLQLKNDEEFLLSLEKYQYPLGILIDQIVIKLNVSEHLFALRKVHSGIGYYVSEKLRAEIESAGCTGLGYLDPNEQI